MRKKIIFVDDEKIVLDSLRNELKFNLCPDCDIETCESGEEALALINESMREDCRIPIVVADYIMPGMKGDEVLIWVHQKLPETKTILLTGQATMDGVTNSVNNAGLYRYIPKPWQEADLLLTIKEALKIYETEQLLAERRKELELANKKLMVLDRSKTYFIMLLAHELKTPLQSISGYNDILKRSLGDSELIHYCDDIESSSHRLKKFTDYSLLILELLNEKYVFEMQKQDIYYLLGIVLMNMQTKMAKKNISLLKQLSFKKMELFYDPLLIMKVLDIVIDNAVKYSNSNSEIIISDSLQDNIYTLSIIDNGKGFSSETIDNLFKFFVSDDIMHHSVGYGLGLATAKMIMDAHKNSIVIANRDPGAIVNLIFTIKTC